MANHDLSPAELRAINDLRTASRKLAAAFKRNGKTTNAREVIADANNHSRTFDALTGQSHAPLEL